MHPKMKDQVDRELEKLRRCQPNAQVLQERYSKAHQAYVNAVHDPEGYGEEHHGNAKFDNYAAKEACLIYAAEVGIKLEV